MLLVPWSSQDSDWMTRLFSVAVDNSLCCECMVFFFISSYQYSIIGVSLSNHKGSPDVHQRCCTSRSTPRSGPRAQVSEHTPTCACIIQHYHKFSAKIRSLPKLKRVLQFFYEIMHGFWYKKEKKKYRSGIVRWPISLSTNNYFHWKRCALYCHFCSHCYKKIYMRSSNTAAVSGLAVMELKYV